MSAEVSDPQEHGVPCPTQIPTGVTTLKKADFRTFYRDAHAVECITEREKMLIGLTVAMMRLCDP